jgi:hypothetical protein
MGRTERTDTKVVMGEGLLEALGGMGDFTATAEIMTARR